MLKTILPGDDPTFHHNNGFSESQIDHILTNDTELVSYLKQLCKLDDPTNLSSHDAIIGTIQIDEPKVDDDSDFSNTYEEFIPKKIIWRENQEYQEMTADILHKLMTNFDQPEHLPALAEMSSNMIVMCSENDFNSSNLKSHRRSKHSDFLKH